MFVRGHVFGMMGWLLVVGVGCKQGDDGSGTKPADSASSKPAVTATAADTKPTTTTATGEVALPAGDPYKLNALSTIAMPKPPGAPASGTWKHVAGNESDGYGQLNYVDKDNYWYGVDFLDCRAKVVKDAASMKPEDRGATKWCFMQPNAKLKDYPMIKPEKGSARAVKAGNVWVVVSLGMTGMETLKAADVEAYLNSLDLAAVAKL
jgi:hypothetical protein